MSGSASVFASTLADRTPPTLTGVVINEGQPHLLPQEALEIVVDAHDDPGGFGVDAARVSFDEGITWTDWLALSGPSCPSIPSPAQRGLRTVTVVVRDRAGNDSNTVSTPTYFLERDLVTASGGGKLRGTLDSLRDVDAISVGLAAGDALSVKLKAKPAAKKEPFDLCLDIVGPAGRLHLGRYPADAKRTMIAGFVAPGTGTYLVVLRRDGQEGSTTGSYALSVKVKQAKRNRRWKGASFGAGIPFAAAEGSTLQTNLEGEGLTAAQVSLEGPKGVVPIQPRQGKNQVRHLPTVLGSGTGTYVIRIPGDAEVVFSGSVKLPPKRKGESIP